MERLRQVDQLRQFLTGHLPLLIVDLAFVGLFLGVLLCSRRLWAWSPWPRCRSSSSLSALAQRRQEAAPACELPRRRRQGLGPRRGHHPGAHRQAAGARGRHAAALRGATCCAVPGPGCESGRVGQLAGSLGQALQHVTALVLVYLGARMIVSGELTVGALVAASILSARALAPMRQLSLAWTQLRQAREALAPPRRDAARARGGQRPPGRTSSRLTGRLAARGSHLPLPRCRGAGAGRCEPSSSSPARMLGIAGAPGLGQEHPGPLLLGVERPRRAASPSTASTSPASPRSSYRPQIGVVPQEVQLFSGTVAENIGMGAADRSLRPDRGRRPLRRRRRLHPRLPAGLRDRPRRARRRPVAGPAPAPDHRPGHRPQPAAS